MSTKTFRLKVKQIPLSRDIIYKKPNFPPFEELYLDLLENKNKLKKNPPKPKFVRLSPAPEQQSSKREYFDKQINDDEFTLEQLEKAYENEISEDLFSNSKSESREIFQDKVETGGDTDNQQEYKKEDFDKEQEEEEDEETRERNEKADLLFKLMVLKRKYPNAEIPNFTEQSDINSMRRFYDQIIRKVSLDSSIETYKQWLGGGFMVVEWVSTNMIGFDLSGLAVSQQNNMNKYDELLVELGEKHHSIKGSRFPVELRLVFAILFNTAMFYVQKNMMGGGQGSMFNMFTPQPPQGTRQRRARMGGPTIKPQDVENLGGQSETDSDDGLD